MLKKSLTLVSALALVLVSSSCVLAESDEQTELREQIDTLCKELHEASENEALDNFLEKNTQQLNALLMNGESFASSSAETKKERFCRQLKELYQRIEDDTNSGRKASLERTVKSMRMEFEPMKEFLRKVKDKGIELKDATYNKMKGLKDSISEKGEKLKDTIKEKGTE